MKIKIKIKNKITRRAPKKALFRLLVNLNPILPLSGPFNPPIFSFSSNQNNS